MSGFGKSEALKALHLVAETMRKEKAVLAERRGVAVDEQYIEGFEHARDILEFHIRTQVHMERQVDRVLSSGTPDRPTHVWHPPGYASRYVSVGKRLTGPDFARYEVRAFEGTEPAGDFVARDTDLTPLDPRHRHAEDEL